MAEPYRASFANVTSAVHARWKMQLLRLVLQLQLLPLPPPPPPPVLQQLLLLRPALALLLQ